MTPYIPPGKTVRFAAFLVAQFCLESNKWLKNLVESIIERCWPTS